MAQAFLNPLPLCWVLEWGSLCASPLNAECWFPPAPRLSWGWTPLIFKAGHRESWSSQGRPWSRGLVPHVGLESLAPRGNFHAYVSLFTVDYLTLQVSPDQTLSLLLSTLLRVAFSFYLWLWKSRPASLRVLLRDNCSICSCSLGVSMGGCEFRFLLLHHLPEY